MVVKMPMEPAYYYECSYGSFRLVYHIPRSILEDLTRTDQIKEKVLVDFPDGADIDCSEPDYNAFKKSYDYKPPARPEQLHRAFYALFTTLELDVPWEEFKGSGYIKAEKLEDKVAEIEGSLKERDVQLVEDIVIPKKLTLEEKRQIIVKRTAQQTIVETALETISAEIAKNEFAPDSPPTRQSLIPEMGEGEAPEEIFSRAQKGLRKK